MGVSENNLKLGLDRIGCPAAAFCAIANFSETKFSRAVRGLQPLNGGEIQQLTKLLTQIRDLCYDASPLPVSFRDPGAIKKLLAHRRAGVRLVPVPVGPAGAVADFETEFMEAQPLAAAQ